MSYFIRNAFLGLIRVYQIFISPLIHTLAGPGYGCRFFPSCSEYGIEALRTHAPAKAIRLILARVVRCRPGCPGGFDPVPRGNA